MRRRGGAHWTAVLALKPLAQAKTRLRCELSNEQRASLALAMAGDAVESALACAVIGRCLVVTADRFAAATLRRLGASIALEPAPRGLNAAFELGRQWVLGSGGGRLALMMADLPECRPAALEDFLNLVPERRAGLVADLDGTGTTLLAAADARIVRPRFGPDSRRRHAEAGAMDLTSAVAAELRRDVDDWAALTSLSAAGRHTRAVLSQPICL